MKLPASASHLHDCHFGVSEERVPGYLDGMEPSPSRACPICGKPVATRFRPFCSGRCKDVDLNRWLTGAYAIPAVESEDDSDGEALMREQARDRESD
jgi:endogenous inhibitor of DNA gyrase (YacG/DUF329 family)